MIRLRGHDERYVSRSPRDSIYAAGIATGHATFDIEPASWEQFDATRLTQHREVAVDANGTVLGWVVAPPASERCAYAGVVEHSLYVISPRRAAGSGCWFGPAVTPGSRLGDAERVPTAKVPLTYATVMAVATPVVRWWGRLEVIGQDLIPASGPTILMVNHDSAWDPVIVGVAARRQIRALAKASLWRAAPMAWVLDRMGQIPIERGRGDAAALSAAIEHLQQGQCIGVFPEGTVSRGRTMPVLSGAGRLALAVPGTRVLGVRVTGAVDIIRVPHRPAIRVEFFDPEGGQPTPQESAIALTHRVMTQVRAQAPAALPGRAKKRAHYRRFAEDHTANRDPT